MLGDVACPDMEEGQLMWHYQDDKRVDFGPFTESEMREWWIEGNFYPDLKVRLKSMDHHVELHTLYPMGDPPRWKKTTLLSDYRQRPERSVAATAETTEKKEEQVLNPPEEPEDRGEESVHEFVGEDSSPIAAFGEAKYDGRMTEEKSELPEPQTAPCAGAPDGAASDVSVEAHYATIFKDIKYPMKNIPPIEPIKTDRKKTVPFLMKDGYETMARHFRPS
jgi:hypothetical protein